MGLAYMVALDIDGTLLRTGEPVPEVTVQAVKRARAAGHHVILASGRSLVGVLPVAHQLGITNGLVVASNGAVTARLTPGASAGFVLEHVLRFDVGPVIDLALRLLPGARIGVEETGVGYWVNQLFESDQINGAQRIVDRDTIGQLSSARVIVQADDVHLIVDGLRALRVIVNPVGDGWLDVTPAGRSKATALEKIRADLGVLPEHTIVVGDGMNDAEALVWAAHGVAMAHAPDALKAVADHVTGTIDDHGVVPVLRSLVFGTVDGRRSLCRPLSTSLT
jgi:hydroxymethylpyrimidine pyrophosphatase-like HAD family hydrolase